MLGIVKAYTTRVGAGPFPTELDDDVGRHLSRVGQEFGAVTGRPRRTGWFDAVALRRSIVNNGITGLCVTKLDVLDGLAEVKLCVEYGADGTPRYESMPGWQEPDRGAALARPSCRPRRAPTSRGSSRPAACPSR